jgi:DNA-binding NtrC family response regulator
MNSVQKKILIIDDEEDINLTVRSILENNGFKVDSFSNPMFALENFVPGGHFRFLVDVIHGQINNIKKCSGYIHRSKGTCAKP